MASEQGASNTSATHSHHDDGTNTDTKTGSSTTDTSSDHLLSQRMGQQCSVESTTEAGKRWNIFSVATQVVLGKWDLLRVAVEDRWGGPRSVQTYDAVLDDLLENIVEQWDKGNDLYTESIQDFLVDVLENDFNCDVEDDEVVMPVCQHIQRLYRQCARGDMAEATALMDEFETVKKQIHGGQRQNRPQTNSDDAGDDEPMDASAKGTAPEGTPSLQDESMPGASGEPDEEGWITVTRK